MEQYRARLESVGFQVDLVEDFGEHGSWTRKWFTPLEEQLASTLTLIAAKLSTVLNMMRESGHALVNAGKADAFTPLCFIVAKKAS
jgi:hypothetical protein